MSGEAPRLELYLRSLAPSTARLEQERVVERCQALDAAGDIAAFEIAVCGDCVCPRSATADTAPGRRLLDRYEEFQAWADERGRELESFEERDFDSVVADTRVTGVVFPRLTLAEYRDGALTFVAPSARTGEVATVQERLHQYD